MTIISYRVKTISELLGQPLAIPKYQRPYKWKPRHVNQLIDDILNHREKSCYRLGTVVLYTGEDAKLHIVDGQQRLLTLTVICAVLDPEQKFFSSSLLDDSGFTSPVSIDHLKHNAQVIHGRFAGWENSDRQSLLTFIINKCEMIEVTLDDVSEAFQFFDSQNARGKALAAHDLLKAYHLREMKNIPEQCQQAYVELWEKSINPNDKSANLHTIMGEFLFRMRRWIDGDYGIQFSHHNIDVFKGISLENINYPYTKPLHVTDSAIQIKPYPFQVDQVIINGKRFFEYIQHYIAMYFKLFSGEQALLRNFVTKYTVYKGSTRKGDCYVKNLFMCSIMYYFDKFGDTELEQMVKICYRWSYFLRLNLQSIGMNSIDNYARNSSSLFRAISKALHPQQVLNFQPIHADSRNIRFKNAPSVENSIKIMILGESNA